MPTHRHNVPGPLTQRPRQYIYPSAYTDGMTTQALAHLTTLADPTRGRLVLALESHELTVSELIAILQLPQSTVSRHLKVLSEEGWVTSRADGTSRYYRKANDQGDWTDRLWLVVSEDLRTSAIARQDLGRLKAVVGDRRRRSREFFSSVAGQWEQLRRDLFGSRLDLQVALALLPKHSVVGDLGCGDGQLSAMLAPWAERVVAVDASTQMLAAARERLAAFSNVEVLHADLERLPIPDASLDVAVLALVLHYLADPPAVLAEAHRALRQGGRIVVVDMMPHDREELRQTMGHVWPGFSDSQMTTWLREAGFDDVQTRALPADPEARGPAVMLAGGTRT